jgi:hypothetical protein
MGFRLALASMLLSLAAAHAQTSEGPWRVGPVSREPLPELTPEQIAECREQAHRRGYPCDNTRGCFNPTPDQLASAERDCRLQRSLEIRANEVRKKLLEDERGSRKAN